MADLTAYQKEETRRQSYEMTYRVEKEDTDFAHRDANPRLLNMEQNHLADDMLREKKARYHDRRRAVERAWFEKAAISVGEVERRGDEREKAYYQPFNLKEFEIFLKNSDRGGNSEQYNDVATELERYNRLNEDAGENESAALRTSLRQSCDTYLSVRKSPFSTSGKIRKALVGALSDKVAEG